MSELIDNTELNEVMAILEELEDEVLAVELLKEFNSKTKQLGILLLNQDDSLGHAEWKKLCDDAQLDVNRIVKRIKEL
ncbi:MAG: hypothetical protein KAG61_13965 [Bacteriovoracaceae bacterium]|nr:hypothetical protein [Bacteriovoracaceae bacterium]